MVLHVYDKENKVLKPFFTQRRPSRQCKKTCSTNSGEIKAIQQSLIKKFFKKRKYRRQRRRKIYKQSFLTARKSFLNG